MSTIGAPETALPRFHPDLARRRLKGTIFYGACVAAIAVTLLALLLLLLDILGRGLPGLSLEFLQNPPSRKPAPSPGSHAWSVARRDLR